MIWLFKIDEVFWNNKPKVNEFYTFDVDDIHFDITEYDISLYFDLADYFLLSDSNEDDVYQLQLVSINRNPTRVIIPKNTEMYIIIKEFYRDNKKHEKDNMEELNKNTEIDNKDKKLQISDVINMFLTDEKIRNESLIEGVNNNEGRSGFIHGANFVLDIIKRNCL